MSNENTQSTLTKVECVIIILIGIPLGVVGVMIILPEVLSPYMDACRTLAINVYEVGFAECVQYMEVNPGATGQDVVDYSYTITNNNNLKELLDNPIEPSG